MNLSATPIKDVKELDSHMNELRLIEAVKKLIERVDAIEKHLGIKLIKPKKELIQVGKFEPYIHEVLANGKIFSAFSIAEEIRINHPELPPFKDLALQNACIRLYHKNIIAKIALATYRKK